MILVTGALTGKAIAIPLNNVGLVMRVKKTELDSELDYPKEFTRIYFKEKTGEKSHADCTELVEEVITQKLLLN